MVVRTVAVINQKGGCGKTTTAINLAGVFASAGARTLLVDLDPQSHCAAGLAIPEQRIDLDIGDAMLQAPGRSLDKARVLWRVRRNLDLAPSRMKLAGLEAAQGGLASAPDREHRLRLLLGQLGGEYDIGLVDCSPSIGLLTFNALVAADAVLIPVETSFFSLQGATKQVAAIQSLNRRLGLRTPYWLLPTIHEESSPLARDLLEELRRRYEDRVCPTVIRQDMSVREAASFGQPVIDYAPSSHGARDHGELARWLGALLSIPMPEAVDWPESVHGSAPGPSREVPMERPAAPRAGEGSPAIVRATEDRPEPEPPVDVTVRATAESERGLMQRLAKVSREIGGGSKTPAPSEAPAADAASEKASDAVPDPAPDPAETLSRAEDLLRRACALQRRVAGQGTRVVPEPAEEPAESPASESTADDRTIETPRREPTASVRRLLGARATTSGVLFVQPLSAGRTLAVAGDFNNWSSTAHPMRANEQLGVFEVCIALPPGAHQYRLVADGRWVSDPHNPNQKVNPFGEPNSLIVVPAQPRVAALPTR